MNTIKIKNEAINILGIIYYWFFDNISNIIYNQKNKDTLKKQGNTTFIPIPEEKAIFYKLDLPKEARRDISQAIEIRLHKLSPWTIDDTTWTYLAPKIINNRCEVLVALTSKNHLLIIEANQKAGATRRQLYIAKDREGNQYILKETKYPFKISQLIPIFTTLTSITLITASLAIINYRLESINELNRNTIYKNKKTNEILESNIEFLAEADREIKENSANLLPLNEALITISNSIDLLPNDTTLQKIITTKNETTLTFQTNKIGYENILETSKFDILNFTQVEGTEIFNLTARTKF